MSMIIRGSNFQAINFGLLTGLVLAKYLDMFKYLPRSPLCPRCTQDTHGVARTLSGTLSRSGIERNFLTKFLIVAGPSSDLMRIMPV